MFLTYLIIRRWSCPPCLQQPLSLDQRVPSMLSVSKAVCTLSSGPGALWPLVIRPSGCTAQPASLELANASVCTEVGLV